MTSLTGEQYKAGMDVLVQAFRLVQLAPLDALREYLEKAEVLGPLIDPTAYHRGGGSTNLANQRDVLDAADAVMRALGRVKERL